MEKTNNYRLFRLRKDNRSKICPQHVANLITSIKAKNMLHLHPLLCNEQMEVMSGQHRLKAAEALGLDVYYEVVPGINTKDVALLGVNKAWSMIDFFSHYCHNDYEEYIKLQNFMDSKKLPFTVALNLTTSDKKGYHQDFKDGFYVFNQNGSLKQYDHFLAISEHIKVTLGVHKTQWVNSAKFSHALLELVKHKDFDIDRLFKKMGYLMSRFGARVSANDYRVMLMDIYNYRCSDRLELPLRLRK